MSENRCICSCNCHCPAPCPPTSQPKTDKQLNFFIFAGARLLWDGVSFLELTVPPKMRGNMCGLCGNFNGDKRDDLIGRHGALLASGQEFGNSWRVGGRRACSVLPRDVPAHPPPCRDDWDNSIRSDKHCAAIKSSLFAACHNKVPPQFYFKACRIDMCECPGTQCHCEVRTTCNITLSSL